MKIEKVDMWAGEIEDEPGGLAAALEPIAACGASLSFLNARRRDKEPGKGVMFIGGLQGDKQVSAAKSRGISKAGQIGCLWIESADEPGLAHQITSRLAAAEINLRSASAVVVADRCVLILTFDELAARDKAFRLLGG